MVDEKPSRALTRQLDAIPSELRSKPLKRRRVRLKPGDDQLEKTTNEILSNLASDKVLDTAATRKPLPAIVSTGRSVTIHDSDWLNEEQHVLGKKRNDRNLSFSKTDLEGRLPRVSRLHGRKQERVNNHHDADTVFTEPSNLIDDVFNENKRLKSKHKDVELFTCHNNDDALCNHRRHSKPSNDLDWLDGGCDDRMSTTATNNGKQRTSRRRNGEDVAELTLQRLISEGESELTNKLALDDDKPTNHRRTSRRNTDSISVFDEPLHGENNEDTLSQIDESSSTTTFSEISYQSRPRRRGRGEVNKNDDDDITSNRRYSSDAFSDDLSSSYDPSMLCKAAPKTRGKNNQEGNAGIFTSPKRLKKRQRASVASMDSESGSKTLGYDIDPWPEIPNEKSGVLTNPPRQSRKTCYRKYLPPLAESMSKTDPHL